MGTRSVTTFYNSDDQPICSVYGQFDGYPDAPGIGEALAKFLDGFTLINGIGMDQRALGKFANGMECLAAQWITAQKKDVGNVYMIPVGTDWGPDYTYDVFPEGNSFTVTVKYFGKTIAYQLTPAEMLSWIATLGEET